MIKISRSKTPLRLGLAGGGTDLKSYYSIHGGEVLNATINLYAHSTIQILPSKKLILEASDLNLVEEFKLDSLDFSSSKLKLHYGVYTRIVKDFLNNKFPALKIQTYADAPQGSGLGTSSAIVVSIIKAFVELFELPLGEYEIANLAYEIERNDLHLSGGKQDQYAATFGGFNYIEFTKDDKVIVNPLRVKKWIYRELEESLVLFFTGTSRDSAKIIDQQVREISNENSANLEAMHDLKVAARNMKKALLIGDIKGIIEQVKIGWDAKKKTSSFISNKHLNEVYDFSIKNGALAGKISGAGGGGFFMFFVDPQNRSSLINALSTIDGKVQIFEFVENGTKSWYL
jgi:D-glycero-alpha-D-manno-heptose-7-phosphate kinase